MPDPTSALALVEATLDACGIESGPLPIRLAVLRGVAQAIGLRSRRMPSVPAVFEWAEGLELSTDLYPDRTPPPGPTTVQPLDQALAVVHEPAPERTVEELQGPADPADP